MTVNGDSYEVMKILRRRGTGNREEYLVRWEGYDDPTQDSSLPSFELRAPAFALR